MTNRLPQISANVRKFIASKENEKAMEHLNEYAKIYKMIGYDKRAVRRLIFKNFGIELNNEYTPFVKEKVK